MLPLRLILVCVLLGAVTTVGVAWGLVHSRLAPIGIGWEVIRYEEKDLMAVSIDGRYRSVIHFMASAGSPSGADVRGLPVQPKSIRPIVAGFEAERIGNRTIIETCGWPLRTMVGRSAPTPLWMARDTYPLRPLPLGFTIDTIFYGAIWFTLILCPGFVRRKIRQRRGLCPSCGYDMRGCDGVCAECGK